MHFTQSHKDDLVKFDIADKVNLILIFEYYIRQIKKTSKEKYPMISHIMESLKNKEEKYEHKEIIYQLIHLIMEYLFIMEQAQVKLVLLL